MIRKHIKIIRILIFMIVLSSFGFIYSTSKNEAKSTGQQETTAKNDPDFSTESSRNETIEESDNPENSKNENWWLNSGGYISINNGIIQTNQSNLDPNSKWFKLYSQSNPKDSDFGAHPQNLLRLVTRKKWQNYIQEAYFKINSLNLSDSVNRNESNGLLFFNRYIDGDNLYYAGIRVDGLAVVKKKSWGEYFTIASKPIFLDQGYDKNKNPNLIPVNKWIGIRSEVENYKDGNVLIRLYIKKDESEEWIQTIETFDSGDFGGNSFLNEGHAGIRTDFMDVEIKDYKISEIN